METAENTKIKKVEIYLDSFNSNNLSKYSYNNPNGIRSGNILVNGQGITATSGLESFCMESIFKWRNNIFDQIIDKVNDDNIHWTVVCPPFEYEILKALYKSAEEVRHTTTTITHRNPHVGASLTQRVRILKDICQAHHIDVPLQKTQLSLYFLNADDIDWVLDELGGADNDTAIVNIADFLEVTCVFSDSPPHSSSVTTIFELSDSFEVNAPDDGNKFLGISIPKNNIKGILISYIESYIGYSCFKELLDSLRESHNLPGLKKNIFSTSEFNALQRESIFNQPIDFLNFCLLDRQYPLYFSSVPNDLKIRKGRSVNLELFAFPAPTSMTDSPVPPRDDASNPDASGAETNDEIIMSYVSVTKLDFNGISCCEPVISNVKVIGDAFQWTPLERQPPTIGKLEAIKEGETEISFWIPENIISLFSFRLKCYDPNYINSLQFTCNSASVCTNRCWDISNLLQYFPTDAEDVHRLKWSSDNTDIATIDSNGSLNAKKVGSLTIFVKSEDLKATLKVNVKPPIAAISIPEKNIQMRVGNSTSVKVSVSPSDCYDSRYTVETSDKSVVAIRDNGRLAGVKFFL